MTGRRETLTLQPEVLRWARERADFSVADLAQKIGVKTERVLRWENAGAISMPQAEKLAHFTRTPLGYLFLSFPPVDELPVQDFRARAGETPARPSADLLETVYAMQRRQEWLREELIDTGHEPLDFVGSLRGVVDYREAAGAMRRALLLDNDWAAARPTWSDALAHLRDSADAAGVLVAFNGVVGNNTSRKLNPDEFQGFALVDEYAPLVFVNNADFKAAQIFTLAHELAHLFVGEAGVSVIKSLLPSEHSVEIFCDAVAAEFLAPAEDLRHYWRHFAETYDPYQRIARQFKVSRIVAARRALDLKLIEREAFFAYYNAHKAQGVRSPQASDSGDFWNIQRWRIGPRFAAAVARAVRAGRLPYREAYALTGLSGDTFANMPEKMGGQL